MKGVMVGCDKQQEWLLLWWWKHYHKYNRHPVVFVDFGMTEEAKRWCKQKGEVLVADRSKDFMMPESLISKDLLAAWEEQFGPISWNSRKLRFLKPFAMLQTPFAQTVWIDLDCELTGSITPLFSKIHPHSGIALTQESNTGVVAFNKDSYLIERWAEKCLRSNDRFFSDQEALISLMETEWVEVAAINDKYNWRPHLGINIEAVIIHWQGLWGKEVLRRMIIQQHSKQLL